VLKNLTKDVYEDRFNWLVRNLPISRTMTLIKNTSVDSYDEAKMLHDVHLAQGYEGSMLRLNKPYECKRSYNLQKFKDFSDTEATIVGYETGKGKRTGTLFQRTKAGSYRHPLFKALRNYE